MALGLKKVDGPFIEPVNPLIELGAYESLWLEDKASFATIAKKFKDNPESLPSDFVPAKEAEKRFHEVLEYFRKTSVESFGIRINHAGDYPKTLRDADHPVELLYYSGAWELAEQKSVAVVGSRKPSEEGIKRAERTAREAVSNGFAVVSGLAEGIDRAAHSSAIAEKGVTIAVIGTPLGEQYPKSNADLQAKIAHSYLLISQVPVLRYLRQTWRVNRFFFPERNKTMSALTRATIIVEAGETSGTLTQAQAALKQGRKLFILNSCFERKDLTWPAKFEKRGAIRVRKSEDIWDNLK